MSVEYLFAKFEIGLLKSAMPYAEKSLATAFT